jgi:hypothetical protein
MRQELIRVHNDSDRLEERLAALEADQVARSQQQAREGKPSHPSHPPLKVVRLEPEPATDSESTAAAAPVAAPTEAAPLKNQDSAPRPMIKGTGQKVYSTHGGTTSSPIIGAPSSGSAKAAPASGGP